MKNRQSVYKGEDQMEKRFLCRICLPLLVWFAFAGLWRSGAQKAPPPILAGESVIVCGSVYRQEFRNERQSIYLKNISILSDMAEFLPENAEIQQNTEHNSFFKGARLLLYVKEPCELHIGETVFASGEINYPRKERNPGGLLWRAEDCRLSEKSSYIKDRREARTAYGQLVSGATLFVRTDL